MQPKTGRFCRTITVWSVHYLFFCVNDRIAVIEERRNRDARCKLEKRLLVSNDV